jgi:hypothetical protein
MMTLLVVVVVTIPLLASVSVLVASRVGYGSTAIRDALDSRQLHVSNYAGCRNFLTGSVPTNCLWNADAGGAPIYVLGDSNAEQFSEGLINAAESVGRPIYFSNAWVTSCEVVYDAVFA